MEDTELKYNYILSLSPLDIINLKRDLAAGNFMGLIWIIKNKLIKAHKDLLADFADIAANGKIKYETNLSENEINFFLLDAVVLKEGIFVTANSDDHPSKTIMFTINGKKVLIRPHDYSSLPTGKEVN